MQELTKMAMSGLASALVLFTFNAASAQSSADLVASALAHPDRPSEEADDDARRMPLEVLSFAGIEAGMDILEMEAGGGWYTEILSRAVGPNGSVMMQNPPAFESFTGDADNDRAARLPNVTLSTVNFDELEAANGSIDLVTWILGPHELWFFPGDNVSLGNPEVTFREIARVLKPGGRFLAIDHEAAADSGPEVGGTLHRIRGDLIAEYAEAAGLSVIRTSSIHRNPEDPLTNSVFDPSIQGRTDKFVILFEK